MSEESAAEYDKQCGAKRPQELFDKAHTFDPDFADHLRVEAKCLNDHGVPGGDVTSAARTDHYVVVSGADTSTMTPAQIDTYVRTTAAAGGDLYTLDSGAMAGLEPDLILTQDLCRVCAVPSGQVRQALAHLGCAADVLTLDPHTLTDVLETVLAIGARTGTQQRAEAIVNALRARPQAVATAVDGRPRPRVVVLEWIDPPFSAGHWVPNLVRAAGGLAVALSVGRRSQPISWDDVLAARPDVIVVAPCGLHLDAAARQADDVFDRLPSVPVWAMDADGLAVRPGPRLIDGVEALAAALHPELSDEPDPTAIRRIGAGRASHAAPREIRSSKPGHCGVISVAFEPPVHCHTASQNAKLMTEVAGTGGICRHCVTRYGTKFGAYGGKRDTVGLHRSLLTV